MTQLIAARATIEGYRPTTCDRCRSSRRTSTSTTRPSAWAVLYTLSCAADQVEQAGRQFEVFMASVRVVPDDEVTWES